MATTTPTRTTNARTTGTRGNLLSYSAYTLLGAGDLILDQARRLGEHRDDLPEQALAQLNEAVDNLRKAVDNAVDELNEQAQRRAQEAGSTLDDLYERGRMMFQRVSGTPDVNDAKDDVEQARQGIKGAITSIRRNATTAIGKVKAAGTMTAGAAGSVTDAAGTVGKDLANKDVSGTRHDKPLTQHTKAELYEIATARDIDGRSQMSKDELVRALRRTS